MKLDYDCLRYLLLAIENFSDPSKKMSVSTFINTDYTGEKISYHIHYLLDDGFIEATLFRYLRAPYDDFIIKRLTAAGARYLGTVRSDSFWIRIKEKIKNEGASLSIDLIVAVAVSLITK